MEHVKIIGKSHKNNPQQHCSQNLRPSTRKPSLLREMDRKSLLPPVSFSTELPKPVTRHHVYLRGILQGSYILINLLGKGINYISSTGGEGTLFLSKN
jgi:hypothetical protein